MDYDKKNKIGASEQSAFSRIEKVHPFLMMLYLSMMGIGVLFLMLVIAYLQSRNIESGKLPLVFPKYFNISTLILVATSYAISKTQRFYRKDNLAKLSRYLLYTLLLSVGFILAQVAGWYEISKNGVSFTGLATGTYIYFISALHAIHLIGGLIFLIFLFFKVKRASSDSIRTLLFIRNPFVQQHLKMLNMYWHFMGGLWICLYLVFLFTMKS